MRNSSARKILKTGLIGLSAAFLLGQSIPLLANTASAPYRFSTFPETLKRYETEIFRLVDASHSVDPQTKISYFDPHLALQFDTTTKKFSNLDKRLKQKLLSGPASRGKYIEIGGNYYVLYSACQAHWCNVTNMYILYQPEKQRMVGRLLYACGIYEFGDPEKRETEVINQIAPIQVDPDDCALAKERR